MDYTGTRFQLYWIMPWSFQYVNQHIFAVPGNFFTDNFIHVMKPQVVEDTPSLFVTVQDLHPGFSRSVELSRVSQALNPPRKPVSRSMVQEEHAVSIKHKSPHEVQQEDKIMVSPSTRPRKRRRVEENRRSISQAVADPPSFPAEPKHLDWTKKVDFLEIACMIHAEAMHTWLEKKKQRMEEGGDGRDGKKGKEKGKEKEQCPDCPHRSNNHSQLIKHLTTHYPDGFFCPSCRKPFGRKSALERHIRNKKQPECYEVQRHVEKYNIDIEKWLNLYNLAFYEKLPMTNGVFELFAKRARENLLDV